MTTGFAIRSSMNASMILTENAGFRWEGICGPGGYKVKIYKTRQGAEKRAEQILAPEERTNPRYSNQANMVEEFSE